MYVSHSDVCHHVLQESVSLQLQGEQMYLFTMSSGKKQQIVNGLENYIFFLITFCFSSTGDKKNK